MNRQLTMLIVDDMEVERISFAEIFKDEYQILEAENGKQAMEQLEQQKVHIVLLDLCMPVMDGFEVIREMKQQDKYADIPIVAKTAIDEKTEVKALEAGADEYIFSPCDPYHREKKSS
ncbi:MAG: response regulator [Roseburia inulinivorans]